MEKSAQNYIYEGATGILFLEAEEHFVHTGTHTSHEQAIAWLQGGIARLFHLGQVTKDGRLESFTTFSTMVPVFERYYAWRQRTPCPSHSAGTWGYDKECLLPAGHAGEHKHGTVAWPAPPPVFIWEKASGLLYAYIENSFLSSGEFVSCEAAEQHLTANQGLFFLVEVAGSVNISYGKHAGGASSDALWPIATQFREWRAGGKLPPAAPVTVPGQPGVATISIVRDRPAPEGLCSFCAEGQATGWGLLDWKLCASGYCSAAHTFHVNRCACGSVDTPETRAESLRYAKQWYVNLAEEPQEKPEYACAFCTELGPIRHPDCLVAICQKHEREGWRLTHRLELGGVCDTPELREEVLRQVAADDVLLREGQRDVTGARTERDHPFVPNGREAPHTEWPTEHLSSISTPQARSKPSPEEIPLVGTTPHYEWP